MARGRGVEGLRGDLEPDEDQDRRDGRLRQQADEDAQHAERGPEADHEPGRQRVPGTRAHRLVGRVPDVGRVLDDAAAASGEDGGEGFHQQDVAGAVLVAGGDGALGVVDAAHDREQREGQRDREIRQRVVEGAHPRQRRPRDRQRQAGGRVRRRMAGAAERGADPEHRHAGQRRRQRAGHPERHADGAEERQQQHEEGDEPDQRIAQDLEHGQERDQHDGHAGDRAQQRRARHHAAGPVTREGERALGHADRQRHRHADLPREHGIVGGELHWAQHAEGHREHRGRVDAERPAARPSPCRRDRPPARRARCPAPCVRGRGRRGSRRRR